MDKTEVPNLEAPGAGLPVVQEFVLKHIAFPILKRMFSWDRALAVVEKEGRLILALVREAAPAERDQRVLVPRMMGIEDSSRYWSLAMTLEHVLIVGSRVAAGVVELSCGRTLDDKVDTAKVKPPAETNPDVEREYEHFLDGLPRYLEKNVVDRHARNCHVHPWFGCLNPHQWLLMLAVHQYIHRRQVEAIRRRLAS